VSISSVLLGSLTSLITKGTTPTSVGYSFADSGVPFLRVQNISGGQVKFKADTLFIDDKTHAAFKRSQIRSGDVLVTIAGTIGRTGVVPENVSELNCNQAVAIIRTTEFLDRSYLRHWIESPDAKQQMLGSTVTGTISNLSLTQLGELRVPMPPLEEQRRIAAILDQAETLRTQRRAALAQLDSLTQAIFLEMFGDPVTNPKGFQKCELQYLCNRITDGTHQSPVWEESGIPFLFISNIVEGEITFTTQKFISEDTYVELTRRCPIEIDDVLYTTVGSYGNAAVVTSPTRFAFQRHIAHLKPNKLTTNSRFLVVMLQTTGVRRQVDRVAKGVAQKTVNLSELKGLTVFAPPLSLQQSFASSVEAVKALKVVHRAALTEIDALFDSLQQKAFIGAL
jgi:type I restriction enzyme, S subunit